MQIEESPQRRPDEPQTDHHFETPVVREARPVQAAHDQRDDGDDVSAEQRRPQTREMAFQDRWENVQNAFVAHGRRSPRPV